MDFFLGTLPVSLRGEIVQTTHIPGFPGAAMGWSSSRQLFYFSEDHLQSVVNVDDAWDLLEYGIKLWSDVNSAFQRCETLEQMLEATNKHSVIVSFDNREKFNPFEFSPFEKPIGLHSVNYMGYTQNDLRFADVDDHREWIKVAFKIVGQYVLGLSQRVEAAKTFYDSMVLNTVSALPDGGQRLDVDVTDPNRRHVAYAKSPLEAAFESVREYFVSTPYEVLRVIKFNEGTVRLKRMYLYEAALILEPLKKHYQLKQTRLYNAKVNIEDTKEFHWFDEKRTLHNNLKASKDSHGSSGSTHDLIERAARFAKDLALFLPRK